MTPKSQRFFRAEHELADFCFLGGKNTNRLSNFERLTLTGGSDLERALAWIAKQFASVGSRQRLGPIDVGAFERAAAFYHQSPWTETPADFFLGPKSAPVEVTETLVHGFPDGQIVDLSFPSNYTPRNPLTAPLLSQSPNDTVQLRVWQHSTGARGAIVAVHGWTMGDQRLNSLAFLPGVFYQVGLDVALIELPFHGRRTPPSVANHSLFPGTDAVLTNEALGQAIFDLRSSAALLRARGLERIGSIGVSLGAYAAALWASLDPLEFCIPIVPLSSMGELAWEMLTRDPRFGEVQKAGLTLELLEKAYRIHSPLAHSLQVPRERTMIIAGIGDQMVPARQTNLLWEHWGRPRMHWLSGGHAAQFKRAKAFEEVYAFLAELDLVV